VLQERVTRIPRTLMGKQMRVPCYRHPLVPNL
jgi:hypothetical protein